MGLISRVGRRSWKVRALVAAIYVGLGLGSLSMVYPFLLMVAGSTKSAVDVAENRTIPAYLINRTALYRKYVEALFNESFDMMRLTYASEDISFQTLPEPAPINARLAAAWEDFCRDTPLPRYSYMIGEVAAPWSQEVLPCRLRQFRREVAARYAGISHRMNQEMGTDFATWGVFRVWPEDCLGRGSRQEASLLGKAFAEFKATQPIGVRYYFSAEGFYRSVFLRPQYGRDIGAYNKACGTHYSSWREVHLDRELPGASNHTEKERADWEAFVRRSLSLYWIRADEGAAPAYREFLRAKYGSIEALNRTYRTSYSSLGDVPSIHEPPTEGRRLSDWDAFVLGWKDPGTGTLHQLPVTCLHIHSVDFLFRDYLRNQFGSVEEVNRRLGTAYADWMDIFPPQQEAHYLEFLRKTTPLRVEFTVRNFITVVDYVALHGRALLNTAIYCALAVLTALIVNPMAAYALSRYKPPSSYKVLLLLMLTMAFPPIVTQIPAFLMLRGFGLLNTFWALLLPGLANGYSIFLLKGFFDSLPQELYESAQIDGAGEFFIFWKITMRLSQPILAVIALGAFTSAYSNFMMALLICQDQKMWTIMPWLYELQQHSGQGVVFAALLLAALPTLVIFALCQNVIMRGIVVPVEK